MANGDDAPLDYNPAAYLRARELREEEDRMDREVREMTTSKEGGRFFLEGTTKKDVLKGGLAPSPQTAQVPALNFHEQAVWDEMTLLEKRQAYRTGNYGLPDPMRHSTERMMDLEEAEGLRSYLAPQAGPVSPQDRLSRPAAERYKEQLELNRKAYGDYAIKDNPSAKPGDPDEKIINVPYVKLVQNRRRAMREPARVVSSEEVQEGVLSKQDRARPLAETHLGRQQRVAERERQHYTDIGRTLEVLIEGAEAVQDEIAVQTYVDFAEAQEQRKKKEQKSDYQQQYESQDTYAGRTSVDAIFPGLAARAEAGDQDAMEQWMWLVEAMPKGVPLENLMAESEEEWTVMEKDHDIPVANMKHLATTIAEHDVGEQIKRLPNYKGMLGAQRETEYYARLPEAEARAYKKLNAIRREAEGNHMALFDPDGKSLGQIIRDRKSGEVGGAMSLVDAWWHGSGANKSSILYTGTTEGYAENEIYHVETEGLLDFSWRGAAGVVMQPLRTETEAIADVYHGATFSKYSEEVGYGIVDLGLGAGRATGAWDAEAADMPMLVSFVGSTWAGAQTIASPDLITLATFGVGAAAKVPLAVTAGGRVVRMEYLASRAEEVGRATAALKAVRSGGKGLIQGARGTEEVALAAAKGRYLLAEGERFTSALDLARLKTYRAAGQSVAQYDDEAAEVGAILGRIEKVLGKPMRDSIEIEYAAHLGTNRSVTGATKQATDKAMQAEARLSAGVSPVTWDQAAVLAQRTAQHQRTTWPQRVPQGMSYMLPGPGKTVTKTKLPKTTGVRRGGAEGLKDSKAGKPIKPGDPGVSKVVPVIAQEKAINMVREAVNSGKPVWQGLKGKINPITQAKWKNKEMLAVAELEVAATEAAHIAQAAHLAELTARQGILRSFAGVAKGTPKQVRTAALNAKRALDKVRDLRRDLHLRPPSRVVSGQLQAPAVRTLDEFAALQKNIEVARKAADAAIMDLGRAAGNAAHTILDRRIGRATDIFNKTGGHLKNLGAGVAKELGKKQGALAGIHKAKNHADNVKKAEKMARDAYVVPGYRQLGNIIKELGESQKGLAAAWSTGHWNKVPKYQVAINTLAQKGFLGRRLGKGGALTAVGIGPKAADQIADVAGLKAQLEKMFDLAVLEQVALRSTPEAQALRSVLKQHVSPAPVKISQAQLAKNVEALVSESRDLIMMTRNGGKAASVALMKADLALHNPGMVKSILSNLGSRAPFIRAMQGSIYHFTKPWLHKVGWGSAEVTELMKGVEAVRKHHAQRLTYIVTSGKLVKRTERVAEMITDKAWSGTSLFENGMKLLRQAATNPKAKMSESVDDILKAIANSFFPPATQVDLKIEAALLKALKKSLSEGKLNTWDELVEWGHTATSRIGGKGSAFSAWEAAKAANKAPGRGAMLNATQAEATMAQALVTASALETGLQRSMSLTAHLSDDGLRGLAAMMNGETGQLAKMTAQNKKAFQEISDVAAKLGIPPTLRKVWTRAGSDLRMAITTVERDGGVTFLNQRIVDEVIGTLKNTIKSTEKYYRAAPEGAPMYFKDQLATVWKTTLRFMTTGLFHIGYYANMTWGNFTQAFAEGGTLAALQVAGGATVGAITPALTKVPVIGPRLEARYARLMAGTLPGPHLAMVDARSAAVMNSRMLSAETKVPLPSGDVITVGQWRAELMEQGAFTSLTKNIAPKAMHEAGKKGMIENWLGMPAGTFAPGKAISYPMEASARMFDHLEVLQRVTLYNYLRFNRGYSKARAGSLMRNSLYDWNFATAEAESAMGSIIMFWNFHKLALGRGYAHITQPMKAGRGPGFMKNLMRTSPLHPDAFATARISAFDRAHTVFVEEPGLREAHVDRPGWAKISPRTFVGGGMLTEAERFGLMGATGRNALEYVESMPAPTPQGVLETFYNLAGMHIRAAVDEDVTAGDVFRYGWAKEVAARANPILKSFIQDNFLGGTSQIDMVSDSGVSLYSPVQRQLANMLEAAGIMDPSFQYKDDDPYTMRVTPFWKTLIQFATLPLTRKIDPIIEAGAMDKDAAEAAQYWFKQNMGVQKTHYTNPVKEAAWVKGAIERGVQDEKQKLKRYKGGELPADGILGAPTMERLLINEKYAFDPVGPKPGTRGANPLGRSAAEIASDAKQAAYIERMRKEGR